MNVSERGFDSRGSQFDSLCGTLGLGVSIFCPSALYQDIITNGNARLSEGMRQRKGWLIFICR